MKTKPGFFRRLAALAVAAVFLSLLCIVSAETPVGDAGQLMPLATGTQTPREKLVQENLQAGLALVKDGMSDLEIALTLHDYLVLLNNYPDTLAETIILESSDPQEYADDQYTVTGILGDRSGVCLAYSAAYKMMLEQCGLEAYVVLSRDMNHSWNLVKIGEEFYHVDCTWDDPRYEQGLTYNGDLNGDAWDAGFVSHAYFMKSDEEMAALEHYGWDTTEIPAAPVSGNFGGYVFYDINAAMYYDTGLWYYVMASSSVVYAADIRGGNSRAIDLENSLGEDETIKYMHVYGDGMYLATGNRIFRTDLEGGNSITLYSAGEGETLTEFLIVADGLIYTLVDGSGQTAVYEQTMDQVQIRCDEQRAIQTAALAPSPPLEDIFEKGQATDLQLIWLFVGGLMALVIAALFVFSRQPKR